jgi:hypothetical protein
METANRLPAAEWCGRGGVIPNDFFRAQLRDSIGVVIINARVEAF